MVIRVSDNDPRELVENSVFIFNEKYIARVVYTIEFKMYRLFKNNDGEIMGYYTSNEAKKYATYFTMSHTGGAISAFVINSLGDIVHSENVVEDDDVHFNKKSLKHRVVKKIVENFKL